MKTFRALGIVWLVWLMAGCAALQGDREDPSVTLTSLRLLGSEGLSQRFEIGLSITNPNNFELPLKGMSYSLSLNGFELLQGVSKDVPRLEAYSEGKVTLEAQTSLINAMRLLKDLVDHADAQSLKYKLTTRLDTGSLFGPMKVVEEGTVSLDGAGVQ